MSKKYIIVANVGNRSLVEINQEGKKVFIEQVSFRDWTEEIKNDPCYKGIKINILDTLIEEIRQKKQNDCIKKVILFTSDQQGEGRNSSKLSQDTLHAGDILVNLFKQEFDIEAENRVLAGTEVVKVSDLIRKYREQIKLIEQDLTDGEVLIFCDSGGTSQQKAALKIVVEYMLPDDRYEFWWVQEDLDNLDKSEAKVLDKIEYKRIIDAQYIEKLVEQGNYLTAAQFRDNIQVSVLQKIIKANQNNGSEQEEAINKADDLLLFLIFNYFRLNLIPKDDDILKKIRKKLTRSDFKPNTIPNYSSMSAYNQLKDFMNGSKFGELYEVVNIIIFYRDIENWTKVMFYSQVFLERLLLILCAAEVGLKEDDSYRDNVNIWVKNKIEHDPSLENNIKTTINHTKLKMSNELLSIPIKGAFLKHTLYEKSGISGTIKELIDIASNCFNQFKIGNLNSISSIRNPYAHDGIGIKSLAEITGKIPKFEEHINYWGKVFLPTGDDVYKQANEKIKEFLLDEV